MSISRINVISAIFLNYVDLVPSSFLFFFPLCSSSVQFIYDKKQGTLERARVAGVNTSEIMLSYFVTDGAILITQLTISLMILIILFGFEVKGSMFLLVLQYWLMGLGGISAGKLTIMTFTGKMLSTRIFKITHFYVRFPLGVNLHGRSSSRSPCNGVLLSKLSSVR